MVDIGMDNLQGGIRIEIENTALEPLKSFLKQNL